MVNGVSSLEVKLAILVFNNSKASGFKSPAKHSETRFFSLSRDAKLGPTPAYGSQIRSGLDSLLRNYLATDKLSSRSLDSLAEK